MSRQGTVSTSAVSKSDEQALLARLRAGDDAAFSELFELHAVAVRRMAMGLANDRSEAEDITAETFFRVLQALRRGTGPREHVRAYLLTVARRVSWEWHGSRRDVPVSDEELTFRAAPSADSSARRAEYNLITTAFSSLPERWRTVLWQTEVEGTLPAGLAPRLGLSPNATAALARRARLGLRAAYLQAHLSASKSDIHCRSVLEKLGGYTAGSVTGTEASKVKVHLACCSSCRAMQAELKDVCSSLRAHAGSLVFLVPATGAFLAGAGSGGSSAVSTGLAATVKGALFGAKAKVGVALVSTAAAGVFGVAGSSMIDTNNTQYVSLPGQGAVDLPIAPREHTAPNVQSEPSPKPPNPPSPAPLAPPAPEPKSANAVPKQPKSTPAKPAPKKPRTSPGLAKPEPRSEAMSPPPAQPPPRVTPRNDIDEDDGAATEPKPGQQDRPKRWSLERWKRYLSWLDGKHNCGDWPRFHKGSQDTVDHGRK